jgi:hypothetical protein
MPKYQTSKLWKNPHQKEGKYFNYHQRELDLSIHQTLNKPMKLGRGTANPEMKKAEDPSTKTQKQIHAPTKVDPPHEYCRKRTLETLVESRKTRNLPKRAQRWDEPDLSGIQTFQE